MPQATEEMIRWVTPVKTFMRTAAEDTTVRGVPIAAGESLLLSYVSGNRDEDVFDDPFRFDVARGRNKHVAFGYGVHFCLGAALARMEVNSFFTELLPRLTSVELTGKPQYVATTFVGGLKHLPIRYSLSGVTSPWIHAGGATRANISRSRSTSTFPVAPRGMTSSESTSSHMLGTLNELNSFRAASRNCPDAVAEVSHTTAAPTSPPTAVT